MGTAVPALVRRFPALDIVHQTGERDQIDVAQQYERAGVRVRVSAFLDPVAVEVTSADLIVCRAGATTLAELAAAGRPAVLIPFGAATDDHQRKNARVLGNAGAALVIDERELAAGQVAAVIGELLADGPRLAAMGQAMRTFARPDAAARIVDRVLELAGGRGVTVHAVRAS
jgi:UDP-N-acetylglucosamine--N-acetylmuramyl-(pentapeptide) pyrophosphoryl-undecaprenol N-acetylglucosamine transferase